MGIRSWIAGAAVAFLVGAALPANAAIINWTLANVTFDDGGEMFGTFSTNSTNGDVTAFDVFTTPGTIWAAAVYGSPTYLAVKHGVITGLNGFSLVSPDDVPTWIYLVFVDPLTSGGVNPLVPGGRPVGSWEGDANSDALRTVVSGVAVSDGFSAPASVPEPAAWALMLVGFGGLGAVMRSSRRRAAATA
jgi:hypothetical protein